MRSSAFTTFVVAVLAGIRPAWGVDGTEVISANSRAEARGGADVAVGDSALSQMENPATLTLVPRGLHMLDFSTPVAFIPATWRGPLDDQDSTLRSVLAGQAALAVPIDDRLTIGGGFHTISGLGAIYDFRHIMIPWMQRRVGSKLECVDLELNVGYKLTDKLSVGAGGRLNVSSLEFSTVIGPADVEFGKGYAYGGGFTLGALYQARKDLAFGLAYRSPSWMSDISGGRGKASVLGVLPVPLGGINVDEFRLPQRIAAGVAWDATSRLKLVGEVRWLNYSNSFFHSFTIATDGFVDIRYPLPLGYRDQWAFMAGAEYKLDEHWTVAGGYHYATQCVPGENLLPQGSALPHEHVSAGLRYEQDKWWIGVGYIFAFPETLHGTGWSNIPFGFDYGVSESIQSQHILSMGFGLRW
jgi:long-subunit fatty acid transport protein